MRSIQSILKLILIFLITLFCFFVANFFTNLAVEYYIELFPTTTITNIDEDYNKDRFESQEITRDISTSTQNVLIISAVLTALAIYIAKTNLQQHKKLTETQILIELINEWNSEKMQAARASLSLKYLTSIEKISKCARNKINKNLIYLKDENYILHIKKILRTDIKTVKDMLSNLTPQEEDVLRFFEKVGLLLSDGDLNRDEVWESFITKMEPYFYAIGKPFIDKKRKYTKGYYHHYYYLIHELCNVPEYTKKKKTYKDQDPTLESTFYSFLNMDDGKKLKRTEFLAFSEIRYLTGENIRENYNK